MNDNPSISVIVTTYNRKELLKETIDSILNQTYKNFELIVVDNFSDYDFFSYIKSFNNDCIRPFQYQNNGIIAVNRNFGIKQAKGEYIAFCDDDDLWMPEKLSIQFNYLQSRDIVAVGSDYCYLKNGKLFEYRKRRRINWIIKNIEELFVTGSIGLSTLVIKNINFQFDENPKLKTVEDLDFQIRILQETGKELLIVSQPLLYYRIHEFNETVKNKMKDLNTIPSISLIDKYKHFLSKNGLLIALSNAYYTDGSYRLQSNIIGAQYSFIKSIKYTRSSFIIRPIAGLLLSFFSKKVIKLAFFLYYICRYRQIV